MRIGQGNTARPAPSDRAPIPRLSQVTNSSFAPHGAVNRWTYTVPANKKAAIGTLLASVIRDAAAAPAGFTRALVAYSPLAGGASPILLATFINVAIGTKDGQAVAPSMVMVATDLIAGQTEDASTGGTNNYMVSMSILEYDA